MPGKKQQRKIELSTTLDAGAAEVWKALTDAEELKRWFPLDATVSRPSPDGEIRLSWGGYHTWKFTIKEAVEHIYLKLVYQQGGDFPELDPDKRYEEQLIKDEPHQLTLEYFLETGNGQTVLRLVHSGFSAGGSWDDEYHSVSRGWRSEMQSLKHYLEHHLGKNRLVAWPRTDLPENISIEEAWNRLLDGFTLNQKQYSFYAYDGDVLLWNPPWDFSGTVQQLNDAMIRITLESFGPRKEAGIWLSAYDLPAAAVEDFRKEWEQRLHQLFTS